jgi:hypothetical protein
MGPGAENDEDYGEAVSSGERPHPGDIIMDGDAVIAPEPLVGRDESTPLEEDEPEGVIPDAPLWAMKDRRHIQWHLLPHGERHDRIREVIGSDDSIVYVIDDGRHHAMVGRVIGASPSGVRYCLVGRVSRESLAALQGASGTTDAFGSAAELVLCGVVEEEDVASSNVFDVDRYESADEIPADYLPGMPFHHFSTDLEILI